MPHGYPLPVSGDLLLASANVFRLFKDFVRDLKKLLLNSFRKFYPKVCLLLMLFFSWHFIGYTFTRQEEAYGTIRFLRDRCRIHDVIRSWPNSITWFVAMQYKSLETYRFRDT